MVLAELFLHRKKSKVNNWIIILALGIESVFFIAIITYFQLIHILEIFNYSFVALIIFLIIIYQLAQLNDWKLGRYIFGNPMVQYLSKISFTFFLAQFFTFDLTKIVQSKFQWFNTFMNIKLIFTSLLICLMIAILLHEIVEKPMSKLLNKYVANKSK
jgi:peptidoglycan/LPS O-acetylase OafA/YrhL